MVLAVLTSSLVEVIEIVEVVEVDEGRGVEAG